MALKKNKPYQKIDHTFSISWLMASIVVVMCLSAVGLIFNHWQSAIRNGRSHIETIQEIQNQQVLRLIDGQLELITTTISTVSNLLEADGQLINNEPAVRQILLTLMLNSPQMATLSLADENNNYFSIFRPENSDQVMYARANDQGEMLSGLLSSWDNNGQGLEKNFNFFANQRPWFIQAISEPGISWTPVYTYHASAASAIGASKSIDLFGDQKAVIAADYLLNGLEELLVDVAGRQEAVLLMLDHQKTIIADNVAIEDSPRMKLLNNLEADMPGIRKWLDEESTQPHQIGDLLLSKQVINQQGSNHYWLINATSQAQMLAEIYQQALRIMWVSLLILLLTILIFKFLARLLISPIIQLVSVSKKISQGDWDGVVPASRIKEINNLSVAYEFMSQEVKTNLTNLAFEVAKRTERLQQLNDELNHSIVTDHLTQIGNRRFFNQKMDLHFNNNEDLHLAIIDIDYFKKFNDRFGHLVGDQALIEVSTRIRDCMSSEDTDCARTGGEEFAVIFRGRDRRGFADRLLQMQRFVRTNPISIVGFECPETLSISIGLASRVPGEADWSETYGRADQALYQAKDNGRNCMVLG